MNVENILKPNDPCYCLLSNFLEPNIVIPVRAKIKDLKIKNDRIFYLVKLIHVFDEFEFIRNHMYSMPFQTKLDSDKRYVLKFDKKIVRSNDFNAQLAQGDFEVVILDFMTFSSKEYMETIFDKINYYLISLHILNLKEAITRSPYDGFLKMEKGEFLSKIKTLVEDKFEKSENIKLSEFIEDIRLSFPLETKIKRRL